MTRVFSGEAAMFPLEEGCGETWFPASKAYREATNDSFLWK